MTCAAELFTLIEARHTGDTASGGLFNTASAAYTPNIYMLGDPNNQGQTQERVEIEIVEDETKRFGKAAIEVQVRAFLYGFRLNRFGSGDRNINAAMARWRVRFDQWSPGSVVGSPVWEFGELVMASVVPLPPNLVTNELRKAVNMRVTARGV